MSKRGLVVVKRPGQPAESKIIDLTLEAMQAEVGGGYIEHVGNIAGGILILANEDGRAMRMTPNISLVTVGQIVGPVLAIKATRSGNEVSMSPDEADRAILTLNSIRL